MELLLILIVALWIFLLLRRKFSLRGLGAGLGGFALGGAPAILWNLTHSFRNWHFLFFEKPEAAGFAARFGLRAWREIILHEMPKFFSADTVLWYYPQTHWSGCVLYAITLIAIALCARRSLRWPTIRGAFSNGFTTNDASGNLLILLLTGVSFIPYVIAPLRVPGYFLGATFFMSIMIARSIEHLLINRQFLLRAGGAALLLGTIVCGLDAIVYSATHNEIETLTLSANHRDYEMIRVAGADIDAIKDDLARNQINAVWATISFVYPLIFETKERLAASESIFGVDRPVYPPAIPKSEPSEQGRAVFVVETSSPFRREIEAALAQKSNAPAQITEHGALTILKQRFASESP